MAFSGMREYLPGPGLEVIKNPRLRTELRPLVVFRNPKRARGTTPTDVGKVGLLRERLRSLAGRPLKGVVTPRLDLDTAAEVLGVTVEQVRELATQRQIIECWEVRGDGPRTQVVRVDDVIRLLARSATPISVAAR